MKIFSFLVCVLCLVVAGGWAYMLYNDFLCRQGFDGIETRWQYFGGCQVETKPGVWVPRSNYRAGE